LNRVANALSPSSWGDLQLAFQTAFGSEGVAKQVVVALFADANFSANTPSAIRANSGLTQATPTQSTSYQLQSWLTYTTIGGVAVSAGYSATMGGRESLGGSPNGFRTEGKQARFEVQQFVGSVAVPEKVSTTSYIPGSNLAIASAC
jgi:hypothetical protein